MTSILLDAEIPDVSAKSDLKLGFFGSENHISLNIVGETYRQALKRLFIEFEFFNSLSPVKRKKSICVFSGNLEELDKNAQQIQARFEEILTRAGQFFTGIRAQIFPQKSDIYFSTWDEFVDAETQNSRSSNSSPNISCRFIAEINNCQIFFRPANFDLATLLYLKNQKK